MKITGIRVDTFGVWRNLRLEELSPGINVFYGRNEAGKTTLLEFVRAMFYGLTEGREHYVSNGQEAGGQLELLTPRGPVTVDRAFSWRSRGERGSAGSSGKLEVFDRAGHAIEEHVLAESLHNVPESIFSRVFAVGLRELQELGSLTDAGAAKLLYETTLGLDGVSLWELMEELNASTQRLWGPETSQSQLPALVARRKKLEERLQKVGRGGGKYAQLHARRKELDASVSQWEADRKRIEQEAKLVETAISLAPRWQQRRDLQTQVRALMERKEFPAEGRTRFKQLLAKYKETAQERESWKRKGQTAQGSLASLGVNAKVKDNSGKIAALAEQQPYLTSLEKQIEELDTEIRKLHAEISGDFQQLGVKDGREGEVGWLTAPSLAPLRQAGKAILDLEKEIKRKEDALLSNRSRTSQLEERIRKSLSAHEVTELRPAVDKLRNRLGQLRNRAELDEKLERLLVRRSDLESDYKRLAEDQVLPQRTVFTTGLAAVLGLAAAIFYVITWFFPELEQFVGNPGLVGMIGVVCTVASFMVRSWYEDEADAAADQSRRQLVMADSQIAQLERERSEVDSWLPKDSGPLHGRIADLERELQDLEGISPQERDFHESRELELELERSIPEARAELASAKERFRNLAVELGLPASLDLQHLHTLGDRRDELSEAQRKLGRRKEELKLKRQEWDAAKQRIAQLTVASGLSLHEGKVATQISALLEELRRQESLQAQANAAEQKLAEARKRFDQLGRKLVQIATRRRGLFAEVGAKSLKDFKRLHREQLRVNRLRKQAHAMELELQRAIPAGQSEGLIAPLMAEDRAHRLEDDWTRLTQELDAVDAQVKQAAEERGRIAQLMEQSLANKEAGQQRLELRMVEKQIQESLEQWQTRVLTRKWFDSLRERYEKDRQPQALVHGTRYFEAMTEGRYQRVWTRLGTRSLLADDSAGHSWGADALSRGCREQLFLSLRLALIDLYGRNGVYLPVVLDDVLVNFDDVRATAAAKVIQQFATGEKQVFVFTCHEHVVKIFESLGITVNRLPEHQRPASIVVTEPEIAQAAEEVEPLELPELVVETRSEALPEIPETPERPEPVEAEIEVAKPRRKKLRLERPEPVRQEVPPPPLRESPPVREPEPGPLPFYTEWEWDDAPTQDWEEEGGWGTEQRLQREMGFLAPLAGAPNFGFGLGDTAASGWTSTPSFWVGPPSEPIGRSEGVAGRPGSLSPTRASNDRRSDSGNQSRSEFRSFTARGNEPAAWNADGAEGYSAQVSGWGEADWTQTVEPPQPNWGGTGYFPSSGRAAGFPDGNRADDWIEEPPLH